MTATRPVIAPITQEFNNGARPGVMGHPGVDYGCPNGTPVLAPADGRCIYAGPASGFGDHFVAIRHELLGVTTRYGHMGEHRVLAGESVKNGQCIGLSNNEGFTTGPHLHFEVDPSAKVSGGIPSNIDGDSWLHFFGAYGGNPVSPPGQLTAKDRACIRATQAAMKLKETGGWTQQLSDLIGFIEVTTMTPPHKVTKSAQVQLLQEAWGFAPADCDGIYGPRTSWSFHVLSYCYINK